MPEAVVKEKILENLSFNLPIWIKNLHTVIEGHYEGKGHTSLEQSSLHQIMEYLKCQK